MKNRKHVMSMIALALTLGITAAGATEFAASDIAYVIDRDVTNAGGDGPALTECNTLGDADTEITVQPDENGNYRYVGHMSVMGIEVYVDQVVEDGTFTVHILNNSEDVFEFNGESGVLTDNYLTDFQLRYANEMGYGTSMDDPLHIWGLQYAFPATTLLPGKGCTFSIPANTSRLGKKQEITIVDTKLHEDGSPAYLTASLDLIVEPVDPDYEMVIPEKTGSVSGDIDNLKLFAHQITQDEWTVNLVNLGDRRRLGNEETMQWTLTTDQGEYTCSLPSLLVMPSSQGTVFTLNFDDVQGTPQSLTIDEIGLMSNGEEDRDVYSPAIEATPFTLDQMALETASSFVTETAASAKPEITEEIRDFFVSLNNSAQGEAVTAEEPYVDENYNMIVSKATFVGKNMELAYYTEGSMQWVILHPLEEIDTTNFIPGFTAVAQAFNPEITEDDALNALYTLIQDTSKEVWIDQAETTSIRMYDNGSIFEIGHVK